MQYLDECIQKIIIEDSSVTFLQESKVKEFLTKFGEKIKNNFEGFMEEGSNALSHGLIASALVTIYLGFKNPIEFAKRITDNMSFEWAPKGLEVIFTETSILNVISYHIHRTYDVLQAAYRLPEIHYGFLVGFIASIVFAIYKKKFKSDEKAKDKVSKLLKKNNKLDRKKQEVCNKIADEVFS